MDCVVWRVDCVVWHVDCDMWLVLLVDLEMCVMSLNHQPCTIQGTLKCG